MTSLPPPTYYFNGIYFNPAFYNPSSLGLTTSTANSLYLRKTYADTATAQETFSGGILTTSVNASTGTLIIGNNDPLNIGFGNSRAGAVINLGNGTGNLNLGNNDGGTVRIGSSANGMNYQFDNMNLITSTNNYSLLSTQTSGILNIGTGARTTAGSINIGSGSGATANPITIGGASSALTLNGGAITIGNGFGTTSLNGTTTIANLAINNVDRAPASSGALTIASTNATSLVLGNATTCNTSNLGTFTSTGSIIANGGITSTNVEPIAVANTLNLAATQTTGVLNIGTGARLLTGGGGGINIGTGSGAILNPITIGGTASPISLVGPVSLSKPLILGSAPSASTLLGFLYSSSVNNIASSASPWTILSIPILTAGIYIFALEIQSTYGPIAQFQMELTGINVPQSNFGKSELLLGSVLTSSGTVIVNCTASTYTMKITYSATLSSVFANMNAVRIA